MQDFLKNFSLEGKVAWVTGASYGLGLAYATAFAQSGARIVFNDISKELVDNLLKSMNFSHEEAMLETPVSACNITLSVCPTVRMIVALGVANFVNFIRGKQLKKTVFIDAFDFNIDAFE